MKNKDLCTREKKIIIFLVIFTSFFSCRVLTAQQNPSAILWNDEPPADCPFERSETFDGVVLTIKQRHYKLSDGNNFGDTWYPTWSADGNLYSPFTDGPCPRLDGTYDRSASTDEMLDYNGDRKKIASRAYVDAKMPLQATTGNAVIQGLDPLNLFIYSLGLINANPEPYASRYPCGSLHHNGIWYYGTYCLGPHRLTNVDGINYNWPELGPLVGFRYSDDHGITWRRTRHTPSKPLFRAVGEDETIKIGAPHFVDFGKNMQYSPDGKAYLVGHGSRKDDPNVKEICNTSWITGDEVYLCRVSPTPENINNPDAYEFFAGHDSNDNPIWSKKYDDLYPLVDWNNNCGCVTITYNKPLNKYFMSVTDGGITMSKMNSFILESDKITGPWKLVAYMKDFGAQAYFLNFPSKFISDDGLSMWLFYSGRFSQTDPFGTPIPLNPPNGGYGLVVQEIKLNLKIKR